MAWKVWETSSMLWQILITQKPFSNKQAAISSAKVLSSIFGPTKRSKLEALPPCPGRCSSPGTLTFAAFICTCLPLMSITPKPSSSE